MMRKYIVLFGIISCFVAQAQNNLTLYNMKTVPQRLQVNPANEIDCKWYLGMPAISSVDLNFNSNGLALRKINEAFVPISGSDSFQFDVSKVADVLDRNTFINVGVTQDWLNFGFRFGNNLIFANVSEKMKTRVSIPKDFFDVLLQGNGGSNLGRTFNFNWGVDIMHTREYALGYQRSLLNDRLRVGGRVKYVYGMSVISTERNDLLFTTDPNTFAYDLEADIKVNAASAVFSIDNGPQPDPLKLLFGADNKGFGIDLGANLELTDKITLTASVVDLGRINWNDNTFNVASKNPGAQFTFRGVDIKEFASDSGSGYEGILDTIINVFELDTTKNSFTTSLLGEFYLGGNFNITKNHNAAALFYGSFYNKQFYPALTLSYNMKVRRFLGLSASYTMMRGNFTNMGLGISFNGGPEQFYIVSDNVIGGVTGNVKNLSARFGWNHTFGRKKMEAKKQAQKKKNNAN